MPGSGGTYGVELRLGNRAWNGDWEVGAGVRTSNSGLFQPGQFQWTGVAAPITLSWSPLAGAGALTFQLGPTVVSYNAPLAGNTLKISLKRDATITLDTFDGIGFGGLVLAGPAAPFQPSTVDYYFYSANGFGNDGFTLTGTARLWTAGGTGGSASGILFSTGTYSPPVPEPQTWALLIAGYGLVGAALRRRRSAPAL